MSEYSAKQPPRMEPAHPGAILREDVLPALNLTVTETARQLGVSRQMLHSILAERSEASATSSPTGNRRSARIASIASPTAPVAPTTATLYLLPIVFIPVVRGASSRLHGGCGFALAKVAALLPVERSGGAPLSFAVDE